MRPRAIGLAPFVLVLVVLVAQIPTYPGSACAAERTIKLTPEGLLAPLPGIKVTNYGFRATEHGGGSLDLGWVTGSLGDTWAEGEWVPYQLVIEGIPAGLAGLDSIVISYDFTIGASNIRFVDLARGIQAGTTPLDDSQAWPGPAGTALPMGNRDELEAAQKSLSEYQWIGFTLLGLPEAQVNRTLAGGLDVPPGEERHIFKIYKADLLAAGIDINAPTVVIYYQLHEARTFIWSNSLQESYDTAPTAAWGGYLYGTDGWPTAPGVQGSGYAPGSSGHVHIENLGGSKDVGVPIPEPLPGVVSGVKWADADGNGVFDGGEQVLSGWGIYIFGTVEGIDFVASAYTDGSGYYSFSNLGDGHVWTIKEESQRDTPPETGYSQTYPEIGSAQGLATGVSVSPPPSDAAPVGWQVTLETGTPEQDNLNFGNLPASVAIVCPPDVSVECDEDTDPAHTGEPTVEGTCGATDVSYSDAIIPGSCAQSFVIERTWRVVCREGGLADSCVQMITVVDTTPPELTVPPDVTFECDAVGDGGTATAIDNCDPNPLVDHVDNVLAGSCPQAYTIERTWTATDDCGNSTSGLQLIYVEDTTPPQITCPGEVTFECDDIGNAGTPTVVDNCDPDPSVDYDDVTVPGSCPQAYTIERTWTAADACGNSASCLQLIHVVDTTDPYFVTTCPENASVECDDIPEPAVMEAADNCDEEVTVTFDEHTVAGTPPTYQIVRTWTATDDCGNEATCQQILTVMDTTPPEIACPGDVTFECDDIGDAGTATAVDNCDPDPSVDYSDESVGGDCPEAYTIERTWTATDAAGNSASCMQRIFVEDTTAPSLTCAPDKTVGCNDEVVFTEPTAADNCDPSPAVELMSYTVVPGDLPCQEVHTKTWTAVDACGNRSGACSQTITRQFDDEAPVLSQVEDLTLPCNATVVFTPPTATDNCDPAPVVEIQSTAVEPGPGLCEETNTRCWVAHDACGNVSAPVCQVVTRTVDNEAPVLTCAPDKTVPYGSPIEFDDPTVSDNCTVSEGANPGEVEITPGADGQEIYTQCWTVVDDCGNISEECCQTITMEAEPAPFCTFTCWDWGTSCLPGDNEEYSTQPACIRDEYFYDIFPQGVVIGVPGLRTARWTSPAAIERFGCGYGIPWPLMRNYVDPTRTELGVLAGEILALRLNREFSCAGYLGSLGYFSPEACYGDFVIPDSVRYFGGLTVDEFLALADQAIAGNTAAIRAYGANIDHLWMTASYLNWLFSDCGGRFVRSTPPLLSDHPGSDESADPTDSPLPERLELTVRPNPLQAGTTIRLALPSRAEVSLDIYNVQGRTITTLINGPLDGGYYSVDWNGSDSHGNRVGSGVYFCRLRIDGRPVLMHKLMKL
jgi:hypothetical protein